MVPLYLSPKVTKSVHVIAFLIILVTIINILNLCLLQSRLFWICDLRSCCVRHRWILERRRSSLSHIIMILFWFLLLPTSFAILRLTFILKTNQSFRSNRSLISGVSLTSSSSSLLLLTIMTAPSAQPIQLHCCNLKRHRRRNQGGRPMDWGDKQDNDKQSDDNMMSTSNWMITWWGHAMGW